MDFMLEDTARLASPTDDDLRALYEADRARFDAPATISFEMVLFSVDKRGERAAIDAEALLARLSSTGANDDAGDAGDSTLLPSEMLDADEQEIAAVFGTEFAGAVMMLSQGAWKGPVASSFGQHLVRVTARRESQARPFDEVRGPLIEEWHRRGQADAKALYFKGLLERYDIEATDSVRPLIDPALATLRRGAE
jgi:parvulin-like peptidyl-prolyl isomerase